MKLKEYFDTHPINVVDFCKMANVSPNTVYDLLKEKRDIHLSAAVRISEMTDKKVKCHELLPERFKNKKK